MNHHSVATGSYTVLAAIFRRYTCCCI